MATVEFKPARLPMFVVRADYECDDEQDSARSADDVRWTLGKWSVHSGSEDVSVFLCLDDGCTPVEALRELIAEHIVCDIESQMRAADDEDDGPDAGDDPDASGPPARRMPDSYMDMATARGF